MKGTKKLADFNQIIVVVTKNNFDKDQFSAMIELLRACTEFLMNNSSHIPYYTYQYRRDLIRAPFFRQIVDLYFWESKWLRFSF